MNCTLACWNQPFVPSGLDGVVASVVDGFVASIFTVAVWAGASTFPASSVA